VDTEAGEQVAALAKSRGLSVISVGRSGETLRLISAEQDGFGQRLVVEHAQGETAFRLPLVGAFQASNALVAAGLCMATGAKPETVLPLLANLRGARGRLDLAGTTKTGAPIFIDYAHTPDALAKALDALRPYVRQRLLVVFGCGGDRDKGKRPLMGAIAEHGADCVIVTSDNPRTEDPDAIIDDIEAGMEERSHERLTDRRDAIQRAIDLAGEDAIVLLAGKGHETYQIRGTTSYPFDEKEIVKEMTRSHA
jgi:UDP-N-acetylmuramoyl-L-alanyl-D-glutamate--2,6-diaminopimelate ligase